MDIFNERGTHPLHLSNDKLKNEKFNEDTKLEHIFQSNIDSLKRHISYGSSFAAEFDVATGKRLLSSTDIFPPGVDSDILLTDLCQLSKGFCYPYDCEKLNNFLSNHVWNSSNNLNEKKSFEFRSRMFSKNNRTYRWIKVDYIFLINPSSGKKSLFINATDIDEMKLKEEALINKTKIDDLTGLLNRSTFISEYNHHRSIPRANNNSIIVLVVIDLDFFRNVIRKVGHKTSDDYIVKAANTLKAFAKEENYIARFSEDEFIMFSDTVEDINILNERLRILNNSLNISLNKSETITASIGVAIDKKYSLTFEEMLKMADKAVFKAKSLGGNTSVIFDEKLRKEPWPVISDSEINPNSTKPVIRTFGYFDVFINNKAVLFNHSKAKELLALLIDRKGGFIEPGEAISFLWEDSPHDSVAMSRYRKVAMQLKNTLEKYGIADIIEYKNSMRRVIPELVDCDMYKYLSGLPEYSNLFKGFYMMNYSWSEITTAELEQVK